MIFALVGPTVFATETPVVTTSSPKIHVMTQNILASYHEGHAYSRAQKLSRMIKGGYDGIPRQNLVFLQEVAQDQWQYVHDLLTPYGYAVYPTRPTATDSLVVYDTNRFEFISGGVDRFVYYRDTPGQETGQAPYVRLRDTSTNQFYSAMGIHLVAWNNKEGYDQGGAEKRKLGAISMRNWGKDTLLLNPTDRIIAGGDLNATNFLRVGRRTDARGGSVYPVTWDPVQSYKPTKDDYLVRRYTAPRQMLPYCQLTQKVPGILGEPRIFQSAEDKAQIGGSGLVGYCPDKLHNGRPKFAQPEDLGSSPSRSDINQVNLDHIFVDRRQTVERFRLTRLPLTTGMSDHTGILVTLR